MKTTFFSSGLAWTVLTLLFLFVTNTSALACAACYGDTSGSKMGNAATVGIFAMVVIMFGMLSAVAAFGWHLAYRARHPLPDYDELLSDDSIQPSPGPAS
jgi:hypothetical protein